MENHINDEQVTPAIDIDCEVQFDEINHEFMRRMRYFNPFGPENTKPIFITRNVKDCGTSKIVGRNMEHVKLEVVDGKSTRIMNGIAFGMAKYFEHIKEGKPFDICYTIEENRHRNTSSIQLMIKGIRISDIAEGE